MNEQINGHNGAKARDTPQMELELILAYWKATWPLTEDLT